MGRLASIAKARLMQTRQAMKAISGDQSQRSPPFRKHVKTGTSSGWAEEMDRDSDKFVSLRPRRVPRVANARHSSDTAAGNADERTTVSQHHRAPLVGPGASDSKRNRSCSHKATRAGANESNGDVVSEPQTSNSAAGGVPKEKEPPRRVSEVIAGMRNVSTAASNASAPNDGSNKTGKRKSKKKKISKAKTEPPPGVSIRP